MTMYEADSSKQRQVWRFRVPVNDTPCTFNFPGHVIHVDASREYGVVEFWAEVEMGRDSVKHTYQVIGTGQPVPVDAQHVGTALAEGGRLVWHLYELG